MWIPQYSSHEHLLDARSNIFHSDKKLFMLLSVWFQRTTCLHKSTAESPRVKISVNNHVPRSASFRILKCVMSVFCALVNIVTLYVLRVKHSRSERDILALLAAVPIAWCRNRKRSGEISALAELERHIMHAIHSTDSVYYLDYDVTMQCRLLLQATKPPLIGFTNLRTISPNTFWLV